MMKQTEFASALLNPEAALPAGLIDPQGRPAPKRFSVYRNNVASSLTRALEAGFPVVRKLLGPEYFGAVAVLHLRAHPPQSRQIMLYGKDFPGFLAGFPPLRHLPYLADVARLELAIRASYHAADSLPVDATALALPEVALLSSRFSLAPSLRMIRSPHPVFSIWLANARGGPAPTPGAQDVLVLRRDYDPEPQLLPPGAAAFIATLQDGQTLSQALTEAGAGFDLGPVLTLLLANHALTGISQ
jgi:hypothetical protein